MSELKRGETNPRQLARRPRGLRIVRFALALRLALTHYFTARLSSHAAARKEKARAVPPPVLVIPFVTGRLQFGVSTTVCHGIHRLHRLEGAARQHHGGLPRILSDSSH
jgi:hypothetical protein